MGAKEIRDKLDGEIEGLERAIFGPPAKPAEPSADGQPAPGSTQGNHTEMPQPATESHEQKVTQEKMSFDLQDGPNGNTLEEKVEPASTEKVSYKNRWKKLKQYHDSEIYKCRKLIGELYDQVDQRDQEIQRLNSLVEDLSKSQPKSISDFATKEEIDAIGEEELTTMQRLTQKAVEEATSDLRKKLKDAEERERKARKQAAEDSKSQADKIFRQRLETLVPDYATIDTDKRFAQWLQMADPISGHKRFDLFKQAQNSGDVGRVAGFFNEFKKLLATHKKTLDNKVTPVGNSATTPKPTMNTGQHQEIVPMASYENFMNDVTRGKFKGREKEAREWEAYFDKALAEGRLR